MSEVQRHAGEMTGLRGTADFGDVRCLQFVLNYFRCQLRAGATDRMR